MYEINITKLKDEQRILFAGICAFAKRDNIKVVIFKKEKVIEIAQGREVIQLFLSLRYKKTINVNETSDINIFEEIRGNFHEKY